MRRAEAPTSTVDDIPELTEAVEEIEAPSIQEYPDDPDDLSRWLQEDEPKNLARPPVARSDGRIAGDAAPVGTRGGECGAARAGVGADKFPGADREPSPAEPPHADFGGERRTGAARPGRRSSPPEEIFVDDVPDPAVATREAEEGATVRCPRRKRRSAEETIVDDVPLRPPRRSGGAEGSTDDDELAPTSPDAGVAAHRALHADDPERWKALAEEIRMQVLQRIDIFTDTGLREQLTARLQPVVDRASADLVATINREVGQMLRTYVAEAIEREIEHWRHGNG